MKKLFEISTKTIVATGLGAALFTLLFMYIKVPTGVPDVNLQTAYGVGAFFGALFGPIAGGLIAFIGHLISDAAQYGSPWMSWVIASGVAGFITGCVYPKLKVEEGIFTVKDAILFNVFQLVGNAVAWLVIAPALDVLIYAQDVVYVFTQGYVAFIPNAITVAIFGTLLLFIYSKTRAQKGSLTTEE